MYNPSFRVKRNGVPILSGEQISIIGEKYVRDFQPEVLQNPAPVDIESFIEQYLGMTPDYQYLSHNGIYLGMTVFNDTNRVIVYSPQTERAEYISAKARTVIIDNRLLEENQQHRYRFTLGHEGGHDIFHSGYYSYNPNQLSFLDTPLPPMIQCRVDNQSVKKPTKKWDDHDWMEWHANRFASSILMPETSVRLIASGYSQDSIAKSLLTRYRLVMEVADTFDVSYEAATYRLKDLGILAKDDQTDYSSNSAFLDFAEIAM